MIAVGRVDYGSPKDVPENVIIETFARAEAIRISVRDRNWINYRSIALPGIGWWLPLSRVLPLVGITPQMLRPVFNRIVQKEVTRPFPFNRRWFGLNRRTTTIVTVESVAEVITDYMELGSFTPDDESVLQKLAGVFGKKLDVWCEDGLSEGHHSLLYTVTPDGQTIRP